MITRLRAQQVVIDTPSEGGSIWINTTIQSLLKDEEDNVTQRMDRTHQTHRMLETVQTTTTTVFDPVTGQTITVSAAGAALLVKSFVLNWMQSDHGGTISKDSYNNDKELIK